MKFDRFGHQIFLAGEKHFLVGLSHFWSVKTFIPIRNWLVI